jgi:hypothetical protein
VSWPAEREEHRRRVGPRVVAHRERAARGDKHPVHDFLFTYYSFRPAHLLRWSPGVGVELAGVPPDQTDWPTHFRDTPGGCVIPHDAFPSHRQSYLDWAIQYFDRVSQREPVLHCLGLHEWAMVYRTETVRHSATPLRLTPAEIAEVVQTQGLRCTHYDAFRFFTPSAAPLNRIALTRAAAIEHDQPACIHATMDLYKFAYALAPFTSSRLIADTFDLACEARAIDMRASPYDLAALGYLPIRIETKAGREEYVSTQRHLMARAVPLRERVRAEYARIQAGTADAGRQHRAPQSDP